MGRLDRLRNNAMTRRWRISRVRVRQNIKKLRFRRKARVITRRIMRTPFRKLGFWSYRNTGEFFPKKKNYCSFRKTRSQDGKYRKSTTCRSKDRKYNLRLHFKQRIYPQNVVSRIYHSGHSKVKARQERKFNLFSNKLFRYCGMRRVNRLKKRYHSKSLFRLMMFRLQLMPKKGFFLRYIRKKVGALWLGRSLLRKTNKLNLSGKATRWVRVRFKKPAAVAFNKKLVRVSDQWLHRLGGVYRGNLWQNSISLLRNGKDARKVIFTKPSKITIFSKNGGVVSSARGQFRIIQSKNKTSVLLPIRAKNLFNTRKYKRSVLNVLASVQNDTVAKLPRLPFKLYAHKLNTRRNFRNLVISIIRHSKFKAQKLLGRNYKKN